MNNKVFSKKEFDEILTPFIKAYKKQPYAEEALHEDWRLKDRIVSMWIEKSNGTFLLECQTYFIDETVDIESENFTWSDVKETIENHVMSGGEESTVTEILDFLWYAYLKEVKKLKYEL